MPGRRSKAAAAADDGAAQRCTAPAQFAFDLGALGGPDGIVALVVSGATDWVAQGQGAVEEAALMQARAAFGGRPWSALRTTTEKRATFLCTPGLRRPPARVAAGLLAAGDYINGPYPATLEGAMRFRPRRRQGCVIFAMQKGRGSDGLACARKQRGSEAGHPGDRADVLAAGRAGLAPGTGLPEGISEQTGLHPSTAHRILNDLASAASSTASSRAPTSSACACWNSATWSRPGSTCATRRWDRCASCTVTHQPVNLSIRQGDEIVYIERAFSERSGMQVVRAVGGRAPLHLTSVGKLFLAADEPQRSTATSPAPAWPATRATASPTLPCSSANWRWCARTACARQRGARTRRALHRGRHPRRSGQLVAGLSISAPADRLRRLAGTV